MVHHCPDCGTALLRTSTMSGLSCTNPGCPVIRVRYKRGRGRAEIRRVTRAVEVKGPEV